MKRWISVVAVLVLVLAACTGGTTEDTTATTAGDTTVPDTTEGDTTSTTAAETPDTTGAPAGEADGTIIIGTTDTIASLDRKSTRLNSSHVKISYAVF